MKRQRKTEKDPFVTVRGDNGALIDLPGGQVCALRKPPESFAEILRLRRPRGRAPCDRWRDLSPSASAAQTHQTFQTLVSYNDSYRYPSSR